MLILDQRFQWAMLVFSKHLKTDVFKWCSLKLHNQCSFIHLSARVCVCFRSVTMTTKRRLITDSFKVLKKAKKGGKPEKRATPPPSQEGESI